MAAAIFNGSAIKLLKEILRFKSGVQIITNDSDDPTSVAKDAPQGSIYIRSGTGNAYIKQDSGSSTNWNEIGDSSDLSGKANIQLNNLGTTSINADLLPAALNTISQGSPTLSFLRNFSGQILSESHSESGTLTGDVTSGSDLVTNLSGDLTYFPTAALIFGTGIPANTLASRISANTFRIINFSSVPTNATATNTGVTISWVSLPFGTLLTSPNKPVTGASANNYVTSGRAVDNISGSVNIASGASFRSSAQASGNVLVNTGVAANESGSASSGLIQLATGASFSSGATGSLFLNTGTAVGSGNTGNVNQVSGSALGSGNSGFGSIGSGNTTTGNSGIAFVVTGNSSSGGTTGNVHITTGTTSGSRGNVDVTGGSVNITAATTDASINLNPNGTGTLNVNNKRITSVATPTASTDAVNKDYVDAVAQGVKAKQAVTVATTANITLSGEQTIDNVLTSSSRVLVKDQTDPTENGIYVSNSSAWTRSTDFDSITPIDEVNGAIVGVQQGDTQEGQIWVNTGGVGTIGSDPITFVYFNSVSTLNAGNGIDITGTTLSVNHDGEGLNFVSTQLSLELNGSTLSKSASGLQIASGGITNTEINASAAIDYTKLNLSNSIVDSDISSSAAVSLSKLASLTTNRALVSDVSGVISASSITDTELSRLSGVTSNLQTQLDTKLNSTVISQAISFTASRNVNYVVDSSGGPLSVALPVASGGGFVRIIDIGGAEANNIGIDPDGSELVNGALSYTISSNFQSVLLISTGTGWVIG